MLAPSIHRPPADGDFARWEREMRAHQRMLRGESLLTDAKVFLRRLLNGDMGIVYTYGGVIELHYVATVADPAAPTTTELNGGTDLTGFLVDNSVRTPFEGATADAKDASSKFNKTVSANFGGQPMTASFHRHKDQADDTAYTTLPRGTAGFFAIARRGLATAGTWAVADRVDLWQIEVISAEDDDVAFTETAKMTVTCAIPSEPTLDFAIAA